jgi:hypothetical protein
MRLSNVESGHRFKERMKLTLIGLMTGRDKLPDVLRLLNYRPEYFGAPYSNWLDGLLRGPSDWEVGERELFAAYTAKLNQCVF